MNIDKPRRRGWTITGTVNGVTRFPEHPTHEGRLGLVGGEDCYAQRDTFRSIAEAATWVRGILDGTATPRQVQWHGDVLEPHTPIEWSVGQIVLDPPPYSDDEHVTYDTDSSIRTWHVAGMAAGHDVVWTDPEPEETPS